AGDDATLILWNVQTGEELQNISRPFSGPISAICWITLGLDNDPGFVYGCADGSLHIYRRKEDSTFHFCSMTMAHNGSIEGVTFDPIHRRVASIGSGSPQVWTLSVVGNLTSIVPSPPTSTFIARSINFCDNGSSVLVGYLESHELACYNIDPWGIKWAKTIPTRIGHATLSCDGLNLVVSNLSNGIDVYSFPSMDRERSFCYPITRNFPLQVATALQGTIIVSGGDDGACLVFDRCSGVTLSPLSH
ncbi:WD40 repeat-like protein, partial [Rickenella mellea]